MNEKPFVALPEQFAYREYRNMSSTDLLTPLTLIPSSSPLEIKPHYVRRFFSQLKFATGVPYAEHIKGVGMSTLGGNLCT